VSRRSRLIRKTLLFCSLPVLVVAAILAIVKGSREAPYVAGEEMEGITRSLDRALAERASGLRFTDVSEEAGIRFEHFPFRRTSQLPEDMGSGVAWGDYDADGDLDLFVTSWGHNILWANQGDGTFRDATEEAGLRGQGFWAGSAWADFDLDGDLDLYVCGYVDFVPEEPGAAATRIGNAENPFTINPSSYPPHENRFYVNLGDGRFEERAAAAGILGENGRSLGAAWADFDADGLPDLYVANDVSDNALYLNRGDGTFQDVSYESLVADYRSSMGIAVGDWDGDLDLDLFLTHWVAQENALYSNLINDLGEGAGGASLRFSDDADRFGLGQIALDLVGWGTAFVDFDNDGWLDLFVANGSTLQYRDDPSRLVPMHPHLYWSKGPEEGFFEVGAEAGIRSDPPGVGRGAAVADYDGDGDADLLIARHGGRARLLRNDSTGGHWVNFRVRAQSGHPSATGARIVVRAGTRALLREVGAGPSYLSHNHADVRVGLGSAERVESVEITWPGGRRETWRDLEVDRLWRLEEGRAPQPLETRAATNVSEHAVVADLTSTLTREQKRHFWQLKARAARLFGEGDWERAADLFAEMSALDPRHEDALYYRGNSLLELGRHAEASACWERLIEVNPASSRAWIQLGIVRALPEAGDLFDLDAAIAAFETAHRLNREESRPLALWWGASVARGRLDDAQRVLESAHRMNPRSTSALYLSGYIAWKRGDAARGRELAERARGSFEAQQPVRGVLGEGDTRSSDLAAARRRAARRQLFADCLEALGDAPEPLDPDLLYPCVDRTRAALAAASTGVAAQAAREDRS
jgi:tetratricopeptide (TPR) repeat protein